LLGEKELNAERWQKIRELFLAVCDAQPDERASVLTAACGDDAELRAEVEALLASSDRAPEFFESSPVASLAKAIEPGTAGATTNRRIDAYRLVRLIASGGMGSVYLAERADEQYHKTVAIKLMRPGTIDAESLRRFRNERQALALLDHPNIAPLLDGGMTEDGTPYLVMEYVEGEPITSYCDRQRLSTAERLRLFLTVCSAVQYAHRRLIVHRDIKPSNVLVTSDGVPKLLDFGIAKMLQPEFDAADGPRTLTLHRPMTPGYASPEQIRGEPVTTASDVYSLGVVLYELLTGHRPYRLTGQCVSEIERTILDTDPPAPSAVIWRVEQLPRTDGHAPRTITPKGVSEVRDGTPRRLSRRLRGDLDNIVLMALRKEPHRRYATTERLAADVENYLAQRPVMARRDTVLYRSVKFVRRHAFGVAAALVVVLAFVAAALGIMAESRVAARQRDEAIAAKAQAESILAFLQEMLTSVQPNAKGGDVLVRDVLDQAAALVDTELDAEVKVRASVHRTIGLAYAALGMDDEPGVHLRKALELREAEFGERHPLVIESLNDLGNHLFGIGALDEAETLLRRALNAATVVLGDDHETTIRIKNDLAEVLGEHRDLDEAERLIKDVLAARRARLGSEHMDVAEALDRLSGIAAERGRWKQAGRFMAEALEIHRQHLPDGHPLVIESLVGLARIRQSQGHDEEARRLYSEAERPLRRALEMHRSALGDEHIMTLVLTNDLGELLLAKGDQQEAEQLFREALGHLETLVAGAEASERARNNLATVQHNLAWALLRRGEVDEASRLFEAALARRRQAYGPVHLDVADTLEGLARTARERGDIGAAVRLLEEVVSIRRQLLNEEHPSVVESRDTLAELRRARDHRD
jgi:serine/threonine protein kinase